MKIASVHVGFSEAPVFSNCLIRPCHVNTGYGEISESESIPAMDRLSVDDGGSP